jgi:hypothetical protein
VTNWMIVTSPDNYERTRKLHFTLQGVKSRHRRKAERMTPGDRICWYLTGLRSFAATGTITSRFFEGTEPIWLSEKKNERRASLRAGGPLPPHPQGARPPALSASRGEAERLSKTGDLYPWRFNIRKDHALDPDSAVEATSLLGTLAFVKRWPPQHWSLAFQGNVHELVDADFAAIERAIERAERKGKAA